VCNRDLSVTRNRLGIVLEPPEVDLEEFFTGASGMYKTQKPAPAAADAAAATAAEEEADIEIDTGDDEFEFTLDD
jgi:hypothetical protein